MPKKSKEVDKNIIVENLPINIQSGKKYEISQFKPNTYTHNYFKYPCKFIPEIPRWAIKKYITKEKASIFDPFAGSGTTLLEGIIFNYNTYGTEIDNMAKLLIKVKTTPLSIEQINSSRNILKYIINNLKNENVEPNVAKISNLRHWFPIENIEKLGKMRTMIDLIDDTDLRDFFRICFASIIKKCSFADDVSPKPYVSSKIKKVPLDPVKEILSTFNSYIELMKDFSQLDLCGKAKVVNGDALKFSLPEKVDLAITSPPYINAFDYGRILRLENIWLGLITEEELRDKKKDYVGTEKVKEDKELVNLDILSDSKILKDCYEKILLVDKKRALVVKKFFEDMKINLQNVYDNLNNNGYYCIVIGNSTIRKIKVESWKIIRDIGIGIGFEEDTHFNYIIKNPKIRIPRGGKGGIISTDYVLVLRK